MDRKKGLLVAGAIVLFVLVLGVALALHGRDQLQGGDDPQRRVARALNITFPADTVFEWRGLGEMENETFLKATMPEGSVESLRARLTPAAGWSNEEIARDVSVLIYNGEYQNMRYTLDIASYYEIPRIDNAYWYFADRSGNQQKTESFLTRDRYNLAFALIDEENEILYYYEMDR